jgi:hypothetical protein
MADLRITELAALASADLAANDLLPVADISASETKKITVTDFTGKAVTLIADATIPGAKILFGSNEIPGTALEDGAVDTTQLADNGVTAAKLADESSVDLVTTLPASGAFVGQIALDTDDSKIYCWDGTNWVSIKAAGSINTVIGDTAGIVNLAIATAGDQITITTSLDNTSAAAQFLAGPTSAAGTVAYRTIAAGDLPTATSTDKGAVVVNGNGLALSGNTIIIDNTVTEETSNYHIVRYDSKGLVTEGRTIVAADVPIATSSSIGVVRPGSGLGVDGVGLISHTNSVVAGTATKVTFDAEGHITGTQLLEAADIPDIDATKLTTGTLESARIGTSSISGAQIANYAVSKIGETQPTADHIGQFFFNPLSRDLFLWDGNVYQPIGISVGEIVFAGTFDASAGGGTGLVASVTAEGTAVGLVVGQALPAAAIVNNRYYLVVSEAGTITSGNAPQVSLSPPDIILSNGSSWTEIDVSQTVTAQIATNVSFSPTGDIAATNVQAAIEELDSEKLPKAGGTVTGTLLIGSAGSLEFEGTSDNTFETTLAVVDPTADRTITLPDVTGTVITTGDTSTVSNTMLAGSIADTKLNTISTANKVSLTALDIDGGTDIGAGLADADLFVVDDGGGGTNRKAAATRITDYAFSKVSGDITISSAGTAAIGSGVIVNADINASAAIADTKLDTISTAGKVSGSAITSGTIGGSTAINTTGAITTTGQTTLKEIKETVFTLGTSGSIALDPANGSIQSSVLTGAPTFTDSLEAGQTVVLMLEGGASYTVTWPTITWVSSGGNVAPTLTAKDTLVLWKVSTTLYGAYVGSYV